MAVNVVGDYWTIKGLSFDGDWANATRGTTVIIEGNHVTFERNWVANARGNCIGVFYAKKLLLKPSPYTEGDLDQPQDVVLKNNMIGWSSNIDVTKGCFTDNLRQDSHCVMTHQAKDLTVLWNDITNCAADGFQTEMHLPVATTAPNYRSVAMNTKVLGNRIWSTCQTLSASPFTGQKVSLGENAIDIKRSGMGLRIADNQIWGYRPVLYDPAFTMCAGTGSGDKGVAVVVHGRLDEDSCASGTCTTVPGGCASLAGIQECGLVEGNDISDSTGGVWFGGDPGTTNPTNPTGIPEGVVVRGNYIHDMRGLVGNLFNSSDPLNPMGPLLESFRVGGGLFLEAITGTKPNLVYRNTLANIPGETIRTAAGYYNFNVANNLLTYGGGEPNSQCRGPGDPAIVHDNWSYNTPAVWVQDRGDPGFWNVNPPLIMPGKVACGDTNLPAIPAGFHELDGSYDYRLASSSLNDGKTASDPSFSVRHSDMPEICGANTGFGADEKCDPMRIYLAKDDSKEQYLEKYPGTTPWLSPDIGYVKYAVDRNRLTLTGPLPQDTPKVGAFGSILVRVHVQPNSLVSGSSRIGIRVFGAETFTSAAFPRAFEALVDLPDTSDPARSVLWVTNDSECATFRCSDGLPFLPLWVREKGGVSGGEWIAIYSFPWSPNGGARTGISCIGPHGPVTCSMTLREHYCMRAEVSVEKDRRPPLFTRVSDSNNLAQRNIIVERFPVQTGNVGFWTHSLLPLDRPVKVLRIDNRTERPAYIYRPSIAARFYDDNGSQPFPPKQGVLTKLGWSSNTISLEGAPEIGGTLMQILVDMSGGPANPNEYITVTEDGAGGFTYFPNRAGFRESFEWGIPATWTRTGLWRSSDLYGDLNLCGSADTGRKAAAFNRLETCDYNGGAVAGQLISPLITVPIKETPVMLSFSDWSETERATGYDLRTVYLMVEGTMKVPLAQWSGGDHGGRDSWTRNSFDVSKYKGQQIQVVFAFDSVDGLYNAYRGWYVDDVEVD